MKNLNSILKKIPLLFLVLILVFSFHLSFSHFVYAQTSTPTQTPEEEEDEGDEKDEEDEDEEDKSEVLSEVNDRIEELEAKVADLKEEEKSLSSQIEVMNNQIELTEYRISSTQNEIDELNTDIGVTTEKVSNLENSLENVVDVLQKRAVAAYEKKPVEPFQVFLSSENFFDFVKRVNYLKFVQNSDKKLIVQTQQAKMDYESQQAIFEAKKQKIETLQVELEEYTAQLDADKAEKGELLAVTQNDERKYQSLLASARAERNAIEGVVSSIQLKDGSPIEKGQVIAVVGNSGAPYCSTGPHLHFEVRKNGALVDPGGFLRSGVDFTYSYGSDQYGYYGSVSPSGDWDWPLSETIRVNQGYGSHGYAQSFYPSGSHTGIDMVSLSSSLITSPEDGTVYKGSTSCSGARMNYVAVDHGDDVVSWYWHVQ